MHNLFVGQLVRIVCDFSVFDGAETRIIGLDVPGWDDEFGEYRGVQVDLVFEGGPVAFECYEVEPILPEGHKPSEFSFSELMDNLGVVVA